MFFLIDHRRCHYGRLIHIGNPNCWWIIPRIFFTCTILDEQLHEEGYSVQEGFIYCHGRIFLTRASKLKEKLLQRAYEDFLFKHTYSMRTYHTIMESYTWEGFEEELYQHFQRCMNHVELEKRHNSIKGLSQPPLSSFGMRGDLSMDHSIW